MKISALLCSVLSLSTAVAFCPQPSTRSLPTTTSTTGRFMFGGAGAGASDSDDPEEQAKIAQVARSMGMSVEEYQLGLKARMKLVEGLDSARVTGGNADKIRVERDGNNPPKYLDIKITEAGKALGKEALSKEICDALKKASDASRTTRSDAQKNMMAYIGEEMKKFVK